MGRNSYDVGYRRNLTWNEKMTNESVLIDSDKIRFGTHNHTEYGLLNIHIGTMGITSCIP